MIKLKPVIGLEIHLELNTVSKLFCGCANNPMVLKPNFNICAICTGQPGVLPVLNKQAVKKVLELGIALQGDVFDECWFDRKNYFYPDLPKGYQISQYKLPLIANGFLKINVNNELVKINFERIHLEEDTAKFIHSKKDKSSWLDFNRAGVPLLELVTRPVINSPIHAKIFLQELQRIVRYLNISSADMEKGQMRCDVNISLRPLDEEKKLYTKTEIKNLNSFKAVENALVYEIKRQTGLWEKNKHSKKQTTRGWNDKQAKTFEQRSKEGEKDYRYFPEPDLPILYSNKNWPIDLENIKKSLPELPLDKIKRFIDVYGFDSYQAKILCENVNLSNWTERVVSELRSWLISTETVEGSAKDIWEQNKTKLTKLIGNWIINGLLTIDKSNKLSNFKISPDNFAEFIILIFEKKISKNLAQRVLAKMVNTGKDVDRVLSENDFKEIKDEQQLKVIIKQVIDENSDVVAKYKQGNKSVLQYLIGMTMKKAQSKAEPNIVKTILETELG